VAEIREGQREIHGDGGLADAALAAGDGDEIFLRQELAGVRAFVVVLGAYRAPETV
jgi:hypothetical protein